MTRCLEVLKQKQKYVIKCNKYNNNNNNNNNNNIKGRIPTLTVANASLPYLAGSNGPLYCVEGQKPKSNSHIVNSGCRTGVLVTLIGRLCVTDPYSFMKEYVISNEEVSY